MRWLPGFGEVARIGMGAAIPALPPGVDKIEPKPITNLRNSIGPKTREGSLLVSPNSLIDPSAEDQRKSSLLGG